MKKKSYTIATPSLFRKQKEYSVSVGDKSKRMKSYCISLGVTDPFLDRDQDFPIELPVSSRYQGVIDNEGIRAERVVKVESVMDSYFDKAEIHREFVAEVEKVKEFVLNREFEIDITQSKQFDLIERKRVALIEEGVQGVNKRPEHYIDIQSMEESKYIRETFSVDVIESLDYEYIVLDRLIEVIEDERALRLVKVLYGEQIYSDLLDIKERVFNTSIVEVSSGDVNVHEIDAEIAEFSLFEDMGIPVYLPDFDLFTKNRNPIELYFSNIEELEKNLIEIIGENDSTQEFNRKEIELSGESLKVDSADRVLKELDGIYIDEPSGMDKIVKELESPKELIMDEADRIEYELESYIMIIDEVYRVEHEFESYLINIDDVKRNELELDVDVIISDESDRVEIELISHEIDSGLDKADKVSVNEIELIEIFGSDKGSGIDIFIDDIDEAIKEKELQIVVDEFSGSDMENEYIVYIEESLVSYESSDKEILIIEQETSEILNDGHESQIDEFIGFNGEYKDTYVSEFDLFDREKVVDIKIDDSSQESEVNSIYDIEIDKLSDSDRKISVFDSVIDGLGESERSYKEIESDLFDTDKFEYLKELEGRLEEIEWMERDNEVNAEESVNFDEFNREMIFDTVGEEITTSDKKEKVADISEIDEAERDKIVDVELSKQDYFVRTDWIGNILEDYTFERTIIELEKPKPTDEFSRVEIPINVINGDKFIRDVMLQGTPPEGFGDFYNVDESDPKIWLVHSRPYWWHNWNWKKTR